MLNDKTDLKEIHEINLKSYHTLGIPVLKLLFTIALFSLFATALYEYTL